MAAKAHVSCAKQNQTHNTRICLPNISWIVLHTSTTHFGQISGNWGISKIEFFPKKHGVSKYISPQM